MSSQSEGTLAEAGDGLRNPQVGYERHDVLPGPLAAVGVALALGIVLLSLLAWATFSLLARRPTARSANPLAVEQSQRRLEERVQAIPEPRLEGFEPLAGEYPYFGEGPSRQAFGKAFYPEDLAASRQPRLQHYGWVDRERKIVHLPIDVAMDLMLTQKRIHVQEGARKPAATPMSGDANSGRSAPGSER